MFLGHLHPATVYYINERRRLITGCRSVVHERNNTGRTLAWRIASVTSLPQRHEYGTVCRRESVVAVVTDYSFKRHSKTELFIRSFISNTFSADFFLPLSLIVRWSCIVLCRYATLITFVCMYVYALGSTSTANIPNAVSAWCEPHHHELSRTRADNAADADTPRLPAPRRTLPIDA